MGLGTYIRNLTWATPRTLWMDVLRKAPQSARPYQMIADQLQAEGQFDLALGMQQKALSLETMNPSESRALSLNNMGNIYTQLGDFQRGASFFEKAVETYPDHEIARYNWVYALIRMGRLAQALSQVNALLQLNPKHNKYLNTKGFVLYEMQRYHEALAFFRRSLRLAPNYRDAMINLAMTLSRMGFYSRADWFLRIAQARAPQDVTIMFCRIENALASGNDAVVQANIDMLMRTLTAAQILSWFQNQQQATLMPCDLGVVLPAVRKRLISELSASG
jgi:tetratricopeptide (TPR) repeat protein